MESVFVSFLFYRFELSKSWSTHIFFSAGIGRTGTYIAIDVLYEAGKIDKKINIAEYVKMFIALHVIDSSDMCKKHSSTVHCKPVCVAI